MFNSSATSERSDDPEELLKIKTEKKRLKNIRDFSAALSMDGPILATFSSKLEESLYFCIAFGLKLSKTNIPKAKKKKLWLVRKIQEENVHDGTIDRLKIQFPILTLPMLSQIENSLKIRINIFSRKKEGNKLGPAYAARVSNYGTADETPSFNLYAANFEENSNCPLTRLNYILDKNTFLETYGEISIRNTIFKIVAKKKNPELSGHDLNRKACEYQKIWAGPTISISEHQKFFSLFGFGLEIWVSERRRKKVETFKVVGSTKKNTIRVRLKGTSQFHQFSIYQLGSVKFI